MQALACLLYIAQSKLGRAKGGQGLVRRDSRLAGHNDLAPAATVIKSWQLSVVLKSTAISLNAK